MNELSPQKHIWLCAYATSRKEFLLVEEGKKSGHDIYCPWYFRTIKHARKTTTEKRPVFPRYVFVCANEREGWSWLRGLRGFERLVGGYLSPWRTPQSFIDYMKACEDDTGGVSKLTPSFASGTMVVITDGPFKGLPARVHDVPDADRVQVLVEMFGREHRVEVQGIYLQKT